MEDTGWRERVLRLMGEQGVTMKDLSLSIGKNASYIRDILKRGGEPGLEKIAAIARVLGTTVDELYYGTTPDMQEVAISGYVGAGDGVTPIDDLAQSEHADTVQVPASLGRVAAVKVRGDSMEPVYHDEDVVLYSRHKGHPGDVTGLECVVELETGEMYLKRLTQGSKPHLFHLISQNPAVPPLVDQRLKWAGPVRFIYRHLPAHLR